MQRSITRIQWYWPGGYVLVFANVTDGTLTESRNYRLPEDALQASAVARLRSTWDEVDVTLVLDSQYPV